MRLELSKVSKWFDTQQVLRDVSFEVEPGEVHALAGENGAGKSTLVSILSGALQKERGELLVDGRAMRFAGPLDAVRAGIATIHQELPLVPAMSVADNLFLGRERVGRWAAVDDRAQIVEARRLVAEVGLDVDPHDPIERLSLGQRQLVEIARALGMAAEVVLMDEPTSALDDAEAALLCARVQELGRRGKSVLLVTHRLDEIYRLAHRVTVLRDGACVGTARTDELPRDRLVAWMAGRKQVDATPRVRRAPGPIALSVRDLRLRAADPRRPADLDGVDVEVRRGEVVGVAGLRGSGASHLLHALFGSYPRRLTGTVEIDGAPVVLGGPREAMARGVVLLTGDRQTALVRELTVTQNMTLAGLDRFVTRGFVDRAGERRAAEEMSARFHVRAPSLDAPVRTLSGGNQQKVLLARSALARPRLLLLDEPTRGVDIAAKADIYRAVLDWAEEGAAMLLTTSDTEELVELADRIVVLHRGKVVARLSRGATREQVVAAVTGAGTGETA